MRPYLKTKMLWDVAGRYIRMLIMTSLGLLYMMTGTAAETEAVLQHSQRTRPYIKTCVSVIERYVYMLRMTSPLYMVKVRTAQAALQHMTAQTWVSVIGRYIRMLTMTSPLFVTVPHRSQSTMPCTKT
jgi:hypothetical protein